MRANTGANVATQKHQLILDAAIKVFAAKGYHGCRVSDIATEAGIAYGLVYHYFKSKDEILNRIFSEKWSVFIKVMQQISANGDPLTEKLRAIAHFLIAGYPHMPELMEVLILEISRSQRVMEPEILKALNEAFVIVGQLVEGERKAGRIRAEVDPRLASLTFMGAIESILTACVFKTLVLENDQQIKSTVDFVVDSFLRGVAIDR